MVRIFRKTQNNIPESCRKLWKVKIGQDWNRLWKTSLGLYQGSLIICFYYSSGLNRCIKLRKKYKKRSVKNAVLWKVKFFSLLSSFAFGTTFDWKTAASQIASLSIVSHCVVIIYRVALFNCHKVSKVSTIRK